MPAKKTPSKKKQSTNRRTSPDVKKLPKEWWQRLRRRINGLLTRRPHRSFRVTRRRDYVRPLSLPGYWLFTNEVRRIFWRHKKLFLGLAAFYGILSALLVGLASQDTYASLSDLLRSTSQEVLAGDIGQLGQAGLIFTTILSGTLNGAPTEAQQLYAVLLGLLVWLATVWLLRSIVAGNKPRLRDGLYNSGAPILSTFLVGLVFVVQLLPIALAAIGYSAASSSGLLNSGIEAMVFWAVAGLLGLLSLYWVTSTIIALVIVTLPGMYPLQALKAAGDVTIGRRIRILLRFLWLTALVVIIWASIMIPIIVLDGWIKSVWRAIEWVPIVPVSLLILSALTLVWSSGYTYLLYRKVVDDDSTAV